MPPPADGDALETALDTSAASAHRGRLYQFWTPFLTDLFGNADGSPQALVVSDDGGATWSAPVNVSAPHANTQNSQPMLKPDGSIVDSYLDYGPNGSPKVRRRPAPGRCAIPPVVIIKSMTISVRYLAEDERCAIAELRRAGATVSRELRRNADAAGRYRASSAHLAASQRRERCRLRRVDNDERLRTRIQELLAKRWSPQQISRTLHVEWAGNSLRQPCTESIYQAIYDVSSGLVRDRTCMPLRTAGAAGLMGAGPRASAMTMIDRRPTTVADRDEPGHWEGDLIMGIGNRSAIRILVERTTRQAVLVHLGHDRSAAALRDGLIGVFAALPPAWRRPLTSDQGREMAGHLDVTRATAMPVYFCDAHSPWQRDYFPKHTDLSDHSPQRLLEVANEVNHRPRKTLDWATPQALFENYNSALPQRFDVLTCRESRVR